MPKKIINALTPMQVKNLKAGRHADGGGLYLLVKEGGARSWVFRYMIDRRSRDAGLGPAAGPGMITLADARDLAEDHRKLVRSGIDPLEKRDRDTAEAEIAAHAAKISAITFKQSAQAYLDAHGGSWRNAKHRQQWENTLSTYAYPVMGDLPVADVTTEHVMDVLEPIWKTKPETASRVRGRIELVLDSAKARGHRQGENPARWRGHIAQILPARKKLTRGHHKAMPYADVPAFMEKLRQCEAIAALALEFAILTAARSGEVFGATWQEVDLKANSWTIPKTRMKAGKEHIVPLPPRAVEILEKLKPIGSDYVFPGAKGGKLSVMAMTMLLRRMKVDVTVHGFRSSFRVWAAERTAFSHEVCEMALAHTIPGKAVTPYLRTSNIDKRRVLMEKWATYCGTPSASGSKVTPIRATTA